MDYPQYEKLTPSEKLGVERILNGMRQIYATSEDTYPTFAHMLGVLAQELRDWAIMMRDEAPPLTQTAPTEEGPSPESDY